MWHVSLSGPDNVFENVTVIQRELFMSDTCEVYPAKLLRYVYPLVCFPAHFLGTNFGFCRKGKMLCKRC